MGSLIVFVNSLVPTDLVGGARLDSADAAAGFTAVWVAGFPAAFERDASFFFTDEVVLDLDFVVEVFFCDLTPSFFPLLGGGSEAGTAGLLGLFFPPWSALELGFAFELVLGRSLFSAPATECGGEDRDEFGMFH